MSKFSIELEVEVEGNTPKITKTSIVPVTPEKEKEEKPPGKQPEQKKPTPPQKSGPIPAPVGQKPTQGKGNWFQGTSWES